MKEYVSKDALYEMCQPNGVFRLHVSHIDNMKPEDVFPVVRCKDCKHSRKPSALTQKYGKPGTLTCCKGPCNKRNVGSEDFCSYGERKENE